MNSVTPRVFIAATRQNDGKTTTSLGLLAALQKTYPRVGYIKPVGQRFVEIAEQKIDEDTVLMDRVYRLNCPLTDMSPIAVEPDFTRKYLESAKNDRLVSRIIAAFDRVAWEKDFVLCEGSGHAGVGAVFDLSNARVARVLGAKAILISQGGIGKPIDEIALNQALFEKEGVEVVGVILNKVTPGKLDYITKFARQGLRRKGLDLLGVLPHQPILSSPNLESIREALDVEPLNAVTRLNNLVTSVVIGAMGAENAAGLLEPATLMIVSGDREDILAAAADAAANRAQAEWPAGLILTDNLRPRSKALAAVRSMPWPVLFSAANSYEVASIVHDLIVKTRPDDTDKISVIRNLIAKHVDVDRLLERLHD